MSADEAMRAVNEWLGVFFIAAVGVAMVIGIIREAFSKQEPPRANAPKWGRQGERPK